MVGAFNRRQLVGVCVLILASQSESEEKTFTNESLKKQKQKPKTGGKTMNTGTPPCTG